MSVVSDSIRGKIHIFILLIGYTSMPRIGKPNSV